MRQVIAQNHWYLWSAVLISIILFLLFKLLYPYPNLVLDSYYYIQAAVLNNNINTWPIGYSKFIQFFNLFSHSAWLLVYIQYLFLEFCCLMFYLSWICLFSPGKWITRILFIFLFLNPLFLYVSNYILADALFAGLSILWVTQLLWIIYRPRPYMIITHALLLVTAFTVRYNAFYYPLVAILAFMLSRQSLRLKWIGIALPLGLIGAFIIYTGNEIASITGARQFSPFGGWKLANNALYAYEHVYPGQAGAAPEKFRPLDSVVRQHFSSTSDTVDLLEVDLTSGSYYMFATNSPLVHYTDWQYGPVRPLINSRGYLSLGPLYQSYGIYLIKKYPIAFTRYFVLPNLLHYLFPPKEIFGSKESFNLVEAFGGVFVQKSLRLTNIDTNSKFIRLGEKILSPYPYLMILLHSGFILGLLGFTLYGGFKVMSGPYRHCLLAIAALWLLDLGFSVFSAAIVLRYQLFIMMVEMAFGAYFIAFTHRQLKSRP